MKTIWQVTMDRYGDESKAKSGYVSSLIDTYDDLTRRYDIQVNKPILEIVDLGMGTALCHLLEDRKIPFKKVGGLLMRINGADIFKYKGEEP